MQSAENQSLSDLIFYLKKEGHIKTMKQLAEDIGVNYTYLSQVNNGTEPFTKQMRDKILKKYDVNLNISSSNIIDSKKFRPVPIVPVVARASFSQSWDDAEYIEQLEYKPTTIPEDGNYYWFEMHGDSMEIEAPYSIPEGSFVLARELYRKYWDKFNLRKYYIIHHREHGLMCKIIKSNTDNVIECHSLNPTHEPFELNLKDVIQLFYVKEIQRKVKDVYLEDIELINKKNNIS